MKNDITYKYGKIINMPHHISQKRARMSNYSRAAQFAPFAALTGFERMTEETARYVDRRVELSEDEKALLDCKLNIILNNLTVLPEVTVEYFVPDKRKQGGVYVSSVEKIVKLDKYRRCLKTESNNEIFISDILSLDCDLF